MKTKLLNLALIISSLAGYLEWGRDNHTFLFQAEWDILQKLFADPASMVNPFVLLPLFGQILLIITLFQKQPNKWLTLAGMLSIGVLLFFMLAIGALGPNLKILFSTLPFTAIAILTLFHLRK